MNRPVRCQLLFALLVFTVGCQSESITEPNVVEQSRSESVALTEHVVEAACGQCLFGLTGDGCDLAIRVDGRAYFVDGTNIDEHGDAHAEDGFCNAIRQAQVTGNIEGGRFVAASFEMLSNEIPALK